MIEVIRAAPYMSVQDLGRTGFRSQGMPLAGAMDPEALSLTNILVGNPAGSAALEWGLGPARLRFTDDSFIAVGAPGVEIELDGDLLPSWTATTVAKGSELALGVPQLTRFGYLAVAGGLDVPLVFGSRSTYLRGGFGGLHGRLLRNGDRVGDSPPGSPSEHGEGEVESGNGNQRLGVPLPEALRPLMARNIRVMEGPQAGFFDDTAWGHLEHGDYQVSRVADRMGYRLEGPALSHTGPASLLSEAVCPGAIQVPDGGTPLVLMPDGPTVGGYPKIAVVISADLRCLAQMGPGGKPRFTRVGLAEARAAHEEVADRLNHAREWVRG